MVQSTGLILGKVGFIVVIFMIALGGGLIPLKCKSFQESPTIIGVANAFSGGVFLAIALVHVLPDVTGSYQEYMEEHYPPSPENHGGGEEPSYFPLPYVLMFVGYGLILMIDKVMFDSHGILKHDHKSSHAHAHVEIVEDNVNSKGLHPRSSKIQSDDYEADPATSKLMNNMRKSMAKNYEEGSAVQQ